jgi:hypothetical protein
MQAETAVTETIDVCRGRSRLAGARFITAYPDLPLARAALHYGQYCFMGLKLLDYF